MEFLVPQHLDVEDTIVGPITFKQALYLLGMGGGTVLSIYLIPYKFIAISIALMICALGGFLGFIKINSRDSIYIIQSFIKYTFNKKLYVWKKDNTQQKISLGKPIEGTANTTINAPPKLVSTKSISSSSLDF